MRTIYIVRGYVNDWEDSSEWMVSAFTDITKAEKLKEQIEKWIEDNRKNPEKYASIRCPLDPNFRWEDGLVTGYDIQEVELRE